MEAIKETTGGLFPPHVYLLDGTKLVAYIKTGTAEPFYFKNGIKGFDRRGRKFETVKPNPFTVNTTPRIEVQGSRGQVYYVNAEDNSCTCPGFQFRGACKHLTTQPNSVIINT
jgi:hypothetical protein